MTSPIETIADALIAFILSLLHDPEAAAEFAADPQSALDQHGLSGVCMADVAAVRPVIVDRPEVIHHVQHHEWGPASGGGGGASPVGEIVRMIQQYTTTIEQNTAIDARSTLVDQSVNQNIWTEGGDVTQQFDQEAVIAAGDHAVAAGDDVAVVDSDVDVTMGDVSVGNEEYDGSFNEVGGDPDDAPPALPGDDATAPPAPADPAPAPEEAAPVPVEAAPAAADPAPAPAEAAPVEAASPASTPADVPEPADVLEGDMTAGASDSYEADASATTLDDQPADLPLDDD